MNLMCRNLTNCSLVVDAALAPHTVRQGIHGLRKPIYLSRRAQTPPGSVEWHLLRSPRFHLPVPLYQYS
ncbi:hypothetical protein SBA2_630020 [Acidobacteriia bacterium SbA2]|nr:hypothetical protein SBA2_630020 [Acidobacteriia bacterium SbA2]